MRVYRFEEPVANSLAPGATTRRAPRRSPWKPIIAVVTLVAVIAGVIALLGRPTDGTIPTGTAIDGVDVGGMTPAAAKQAVRAHGTRIVDRGLVFTAGANRFAIDTDAIRLRPNAQAAVAKATVELTFVDRVRMRVGMGERTTIPLTYLYNGKAYSKATLPIRQAATVQPTSASIGPAGKFVVAPAQSGTQPNNAAMRVAVRNLGETGPEIPVSLREVKPRITTEEAEAQAEKARTFVRTRHTTVLKDDVRILPMSVKVAAATFSTNGRSIAFVVGRPALRAYYSSIYGRREKAATNARFVVNRAGKARIIAGRNGRGVDVDSLAKALEANPAERRIPLTIGIREPELTTEEARNLGVTEQVSTFFTPYSGGARVTNIKLAAKILDQHIIMPGKTFSLNEVLGERTAARGFVEAPMIGEGHVLTDAIGGGVSQVATTAFNAAFFAGLKLIDHTPHSFWISRYPKGREATVSWGGPELIFENNWEAPIVVLTFTDDEGIRVTFLSKRLGRRVEATEGEPYSYKAPRVIRKRDRSLPPGTKKVQQPLGSGGFWIDYGRRVFKDGKLVKREKWTWRYVPENAVILIGPKVRPQPVPEPTPEEGETADGTTDGTTDGSTDTGDPNTETVPAGAN